MTAAQTTDLKAWTAEAGGPDLLQQLESQWTDFSAHDKPVATLFGAYDTGKSSILRRLLVDSGEAIPEWLTISARHETATANLVEVAGCVIRDTPGLSPEGEDARSLKNSAAARATLGLSDVLLVTTNPQLPTGERPELVEILSSEWPTGSVWFLISKADEGGTDPTIDPTGFADWVGRKRDELRASLGLDRGAPIYVVVPDYGQLGSYEPEPTPATWDSSRAWDGMDELRRALAALGGQGLHESRAAAERRFWTFSVSGRLVDLRPELEALTTSRDVAEVSFKKSGAFLKTLDGLVDAAKVSLEGAIDAAIRRTLVSPQIDAASLQESVDPVLLEWWRTQQSELARIRQDAIQSLETQRAGRGWARFESLYSTYAQPKDDSGSGGSTFTQHFDSIGGKLAEALSAMDKVRRAHEATRRPAKTAEALESALSFGQAADLVSAVLPVLTELAGLIEGKVQSEADKARERARRADVEANVTRIVTAAATQAMQNLEPDVEALRREIAEHTVEQETVVELRRTVAAASDLVHRGEVLIGKSAGASSTTDPA